MLITFFYYIFQIVGLTFMRKKKMNQHLRDLRKCSTEGGGGRWWDQPTPHDEEASGNLDDGIGASLARESHWGGGTAATVRTDDGWGRTDVDEGDWQWGQGWQD
jgi:hypothetical protein